MSPSRFLRVGMLAAALLNATSAALAHGSYELRYFALDTEVANNRATSDDVFANGNPALGLVYNTTSGPVAGLYSGSGSSFSAGAERSAPAGDFLGQTFDLGGLSFRHGDATPNPSNLVPAQYKARTLGFSTAVVPGTALGLVRNTQAFDIISIWNFAQPAAGEAMFLILNGTSNSLGSTGTSNYQDRLQIRYNSDYLTGETFLNFERQWRQDGVLTRTPLESVKLSSLPVDLSLVDSLRFNLSRGEPSPGDPNPGVHASVTFFQAASDEANESPVVLYRLAFTETGTSFLDGEFSSVQNAVTWLSPVPEPSSAQLLLTAIIGLGIWRVMRPRFFASAWADGSVIRA